MAPKPNQKRFAYGQLFTSLSNPPVQIKFDPAFRYIGNVEFDLKGLARADRHVFVEARKQHVDRMIILQFEEFLDGNTMTYRYLPHNPVALGGEIYGHDNAFFSIAADIAANPGTEIDHTLRLLSDQDLQVEDEQMTSHFARVIDETRRREFLIFYHENIKATGHSLATIAKDDVILEAYQEIAVQLTKRSLASFEVLS